MNSLQFPSYWVKVAGLDTHYKSSGTGPSVILLHGGANDWREWQKNLASLSRNFCVYAPDMPGFGLSEPPADPVSPAWFSSFLKNFMAALNINEAHLVGHSLGGLVALAFALNFPEKVRKVVVVNSAGLGQMSRKGRVILLLVRGLKSIIGKGKKPRYKSGSNEDWLVIERLPELKPPVLIVWGQRDPYLPVSQAKLAHSLIPSSQLSIFPGCRHAPQRERPDKFNHLVYQFLTE